MRWASFAARLRPTEAAEPLMRCEVISSSFNSSSLPPPSKESSVSERLSNESSASSMKIARYLEAVSISSDIRANTSSQDVSVIKLSIPTLV